MVARMRENPKLQSIVATDLNIFAYAECVVCRTAVITLPHYTLITHKPRPHSLPVGSKELITRTIYLRTFAAKIMTYFGFGTSIKRVSQNLQGKSLTFFYAPGENHAKNIRSGFYEDLAESLERYPKEKEIYKIGDSNAWIGAYSLDMSTKGDNVSNKKNMFLGLLKFAGMTYIWYICRSNSYL